jgi:hypothetical protein
MNVHIFLFCYNESILIRHTISHYKRLLPHCQITILDNMSTDDSVIIAKQLGCKIVQFNTNRQQNEIQQQLLRNIHWQKYNNKWIIFADMDEWLYISENELIEENNKGTTILKVKGYNIIGDSKTLDCSDINLHNLSSAIYHSPESKNVCFKSGPIKDMNYSVGGHTCNPVGNIKYSDNEYILKHMDYLGLPYKLNKQSIRFLRSEKARQDGFDTHYATPLDEIRNNHENLLNSTENIYEMIKKYL